MTDIINPDKTVMTHNADVYWHYAGDPVQRAQLLGTFPIGAPQKVLLPIPADADIVLRAVPRGGRGQTFMAGPADATPVTISALGVGTGGGTSNYYQQLRVNHGYTTGTTPTPRPVLNLLNAFQVKDDSLYGESDLSTFGVPTGLLNLRTDCNASGQIAVTTLVSFNMSGTVTVATSLELQPGMGILIAGAGISGGNLIGTVGSVSADGKTYVLTAALVTAPTLGALVQADDTAAVQSWINSKGDLVMPPGYYRLSSSITLPTTSEGFSIIIHGAGWDQSQFVFQHGGDGFIPTSDLKIDSLVFMDLAIATGTIGDTTGLVDANSRGFGIRMSSPRFDSGIYNNFILERCRIIGWGRWGIWSDNIEVSWITHCLFRLNKSGHVAFVGPDELAFPKQPNANTITDSTFDQAIAVSDSKRTPSGSMTAGSRTLTVSGTTLTANDRGLFVIVHGAGINGGAIFSFIDSVQTASQCTLGHNCNLTVSGASVEIMQTNVASILLSRANDTVIDGATIQGNFTGNTSYTQDINAIRIYHSSTCRIVGVHEEDAAGIGGAAVRMEDCRCITIESWGGTSAGEPDFVNAHGADFQIIDSHSIRVSGSYFNDRPQFLINGKSSEIEIDNSRVVGYINLWQQDSSWDKLRIGSGVRIYQAADPRTNQVAGNEYSYDSFFGRNLITNGRFLDGSGGLEGWTVANPTWWSLTTNSQTRGGTFLNVDATGQSPSTLATTILHQAVPIPDTTGPGLFTLAFDWNLDSQNGVETNGYFVEVRLHPSSGIDEVVQFSTRRFTVVQDTWQVGHVRCYLGTGTGRTIDVQVNVTPGPNNVVMHFANFRLAAGKHIYGAWEQGIHDFGGRMHAPIEFASISTSGTGSTAPPPIGATWMSMVNDSGTLKVGYNGVWATVASGTGSGVVISGTPNQFAMFNSPSGNNVVNAPVEFAFGQVHFKLVGAWFDRNLPITSVYGSAQPVEFAVVGTDDIVYFGPNHDSAAGSSGAVICVRSGGGVNNKGRFYVDGINGKLTFNDLYTNSYNSAVFVRLPNQTINGLTIRTTSGTYSGTFLQLMTDLDVVQFAVDAIGDITRIKHRDYVWPTTTPVVTGGLPMVLGYTTQSTANAPVTLSWLQMSGGTGTGGHVIQDEGGPLAQKGALNFTGSGILASNDGTFDRTNVFVVAATPTQEGTVSTGAQEFAGRKRFDNGIWIVDVTGGTQEALTVQAVGVSAGTRIQSWWTGGGTPLAWIDTQPVLRLGIPSGNTGYLELCSSASNTVKLSCNTSMSSALVLALPGTYPSIGQVMQVTAAAGAPNVTLGWGSAGGYSQIQEEGTNVTPTRGILNFVGSGFNAVDDAANNRTTLTLFAASVTQDGIVNNLTQTFTGRKTFNLGAVMQGNAATVPVFTIQLTSGAASNAHLEEWRDISGINTLAFMDATPLLRLGNPSTFTGTLELCSASSANTTQLKSAATPAAALVYVLPANTPTASQVLGVASVSGATINLSWQAAGTGGSGANIQLSNLDASGTATTPSVTVNTHIGFSADGAWNIGAPAHRVNVIYIKSAFFVYPEGSTTSSPKAAGFLDPQAPGGVPECTRLLISGNQSVAQGGNGQRTQITAFHSLELRGNRRSSTAPGFTTIAGTDSSGVLVYQEATDCIPLLINSAFNVTSDLFHIQNNSVSKFRVSTLGTTWMDGGIRNNLFNNVVSTGAGQTFDLSNYFNYYTIVFDSGVAAFTFTLPTLTAAWHGFRYRLICRNRGSGNHITIRCASGNDINERGTGGTTGMDMVPNDPARRDAIIVADYTNSQWWIAFQATPNP